MTHELTMKQHSKEKIRRKKTITLKSTAQEEEDTEKSDNGKEDEDLALITRKFRCFMRRKRQEIKRRPPTKGEPSKEKKKISPSFVINARSQTTSDQNVHSSRNVKRSSRRKRL